MRDVALEELRMPEPLAEAESSESGDEAFAPSAAVRLSSARCAPASGCCVATGS